jgi:hypothetical protein
MLTNFKKFIAKQKKRSLAYMEHRPHHSFRMSRRRDYVRPLILPGNLSFTHEVTKTLWKHKKTFLLLALIYTLLYGLLVGIQSQETYSALSDTIKESSTEFFSGDWATFGQVGLLFVGVASGGLNGVTTESQQIFSVLIILLIWLATVWLLRNLLAGHKVRLRDGLYNSGAPLFAMTIVALFITVQLIPVGIALLVYSAASASGLLASGAAAMLFWVGAALLSVLSLYWITSSLFAMSIVTLPGTYPYQALKTASALMLGRRIKILLRWVWMALVVIIFWFVVLIPIIVIDMGLKTLIPAMSLVPIVPVATLLLAAVSTIWVSAYIYLLYRKVVDYVSE